MNKKCFVCRPSNKEIGNFISVVIQSYETDVGKEYVILGNDAFMKCSIPSFVADALEVVSWHDSEGGIVHAAGAASQQYGTVHL